MTMMMGDGEALKGGEQHNIPLDHSLFQTEQSVV